MVQATERNEMHDCREPLSTISERKNIEIAIVYRNGSWDVAISAMHASRNWMFESSDFNMRFLVFSRNDGENRHP
jgi:hypothetical protein